MLGDGLLDVYTVLYVHTVWTKAAPLAVDQDVLDRHTALCVYTAYGLPQTAVTRVQLAAERQL
jgi:cell division protein YceG involved in septum cleavage